MGTFLQVIEILGWGAAGLLAVLLLAPWRLRGGAWVGPVLKGELSVAWAFGLVRVRVGTGSIRLVEIGAEPAVQARTNGAESVLAVHVAGIPIWHRRQSQSNGSAVSQDRDRRRGKRKADDRLHNRSGAEFLQKILRFPIRAGLETALLVLRRLARTLHVKVSLRGTYATPDPALTGWLAAFVETVKFLAASGPPGRGADNAKHHILDLRVQPDFASSSPDLVITAEVRTVPIAVLIAALSLLQKKQVRDLLSAFRKTKRTTKTTKEAHVHV